MIRIALVDDDRTHLDQMCTYLKQHSMEEKCEYSVATFENGLNFIEDYDGNVDIVFLDIEMPHMDGIETARRIREKASSIGIVFITNMAQYAIKGYEVDAIDFIVKPIGYYVFVDKLKKAMRYVNRNREKEILIETEEQIVRLGISKILYVEKDKNYLIYHTSQDTYRIRGTMVALEEKLAEEGFSKCINGCLVNLRYVSKVDKDAIVVGEETLPLSRQRKRTFREDFMKYIGGMY